MLIEIFPTAKSNHTQSALSVLSLPDKCFTDTFRAVVTRHIHRAAVTTHPVLVPGSYFYLRLVV